MRVMLEPGDATRYTFLVEESGDKNYLFVAGAPRFDLYKYNKGAVLAFYKKYPTFTVDLSDLEFLDDDYIQYMSEHSKCNPWTARAAIMAMKEYMDREVNNFE